MIKEEKPIFFRILIIAGIILLANVFIFFHNFKNFSGGFTGFSVAEDISKVYTEIPFLSRIFLLVQWLLLILVLLFVFTRDKGIKNRKKELSGIDLKKISNNKGTDLDTLYNLLQNKKQLRMSTISKIFNVNKSVAKNWCKTLEEGNLAEVDYPGIGEPIIKIK